MVLLENNISPKMNQPVQEAVIYMEQLLPESLSHFFSSKWPSKSAIYTLRSFPTV